MKSFFAVFLFHFTFTLFISTVSAQRVVIRHDSLPEESFFNKSTLIYPWYIQEGKRGRLRNRITGKKIHKADTSGSRQLQTTALIRYDSLPEGMRTDTLKATGGKAVMKGNTLQLEFPWQENPAEGRVDVLIADSAGIGLDMNPNKKGKSPVPVRANIYNIILNLRKYNHGDLVMARFKFSLGYDLNDVARGPYRKNVYYECFLKCRIE